MYERNNCNMDSVHVQTQHEPHILVSGYATNVLQQQQQQQQ